MPLSSPLRSRRYAPGQIASSFAAFIGLSVAAGLLAALIFMPGAAAVSSVTATSRNVFDRLPVALQEMPLAKVSTFRYANGKVMARFYEQNRVEVPYSRISPHMINAQIAIEDERFYEHRGVDLQGIVRAAVLNSGGAIQAGGSTITQQYVKNMLIQNGVAANDAKAIRQATESTMVRKVKEARLALAVEKKYTKQQILTKYLNIAQFGKSSYGVEAAARHFFTKPAAKLSIGEAALLAGMVQSPAALDPTADPARAQARRNVVLDSMYKIGAINADQRDQAKKQQVSRMLKVTETPVGCQTAGIDAYFCDYAVHAILNTKGFGRTTEDRRNLLYRGGVTFITTLDKATNRQAFKALTGQIPVKDKAGVRNALAAVEPGTGKIQAMAQNTRYAMGTTMRRYDTQVNYSADKTHGGSLGFQPGSSFKPFTLAAWLKDGKGLGQALRVPKGFPATGWRASCVEGGSITLGAPYAPRGKTGTMSVLSSITHSSNTGLVAMERQLDMCDITKLTKSLGIQRADGKRWDLNPSMVLGTHEVSPLAMAGAYAAFAARGQYCPPTPFQSAKDSHGKDMRLPTRPCRQVLTQQVADGVNYALQTVVTRGTAAGQGIGRPSAGKTGTTDQARHVWFVGYTPQLAAAVWAGNPKVNKPIQNGYAQGATMSTPVWHNFMMAAHEDLPVRGFSDPPANVRFGPRTQVPSVTGMMPEKATDALADKGFTADVAKTTVFDPEIPAGRVAKQTPEGGSMAAPGNPVELIISKGPDPAENQDEEEPAGQSGQKDKNKKKTSNAGTKVTSDRSPVSGREDED